MGGESGNIGTVDTISVSGLTLAVRNMRAPYGKPRTWGMLVTITNDPTPANNITWYLKYNQVNTNLYDNANWVSAATGLGGGGAPGGSDKEIQLNNAGAFGGSGLFYTAGVLSGSAIGGQLASYTVNANNLTFNTGISGTMNANYDNFYFGKVANSYIRFNLASTASIITSDKAITLKAGPDGSATVGMTLTLSGGDASGGGNRVGGNLILIGGVPTGTGNPGIIDSQSAMRFRAGTVNPLTAPNIYQSGSLLTTPEVGAFEFLTDKIYFTITTGGARKEIALNEGTPTSGRVPFINANGRYADQASFTFNSGSSNLSVGATGEFQGNALRAASSSTLFVISQTAIDFYTNNVTSILFSTSGDIVFRKVGTGIQIKEGANARAGVSTLVAGTIIVANTSITANTRIKLTAQDTGLSTGSLRVSARIVGTSFTILSTSAADTCPVYWELQEPAP